VRHISHHLESLECNVTKAGVYHGSPMQAGRSGRFTCSPNGDESRMEPLLAIKSESIYCIVFCGFKEIHSMHNFRCDFYDDGMKAVGLHSSRTRLLIRTNHLITECRLRSVLVHIQNHNKVSAIHTTISGLKAKCRKRRLTKSFPKVIVIVKSLLGLGRP
jgi:hypothetical protein